MGSTLDRADKIPPPHRWPRWVHDLVLLAWAGGYLDGEGYFATRGKTGVALTVDSIHPQSVYHLGEILGGSSDGSYESTHRNRFRWAAHGDQGRLIAKTLLELGDGLLWVKGAEALAVALAKTHPAGTAQGDLLRERARENRDAEYNLDLHDEDHPSD